MTRISRSWLAVAGGITAALLAAHLLGAARERRKALRSGKICELADLWTTVQGLRLYAHGSRRAAGARHVPVVLVHGFGISSSYFVPTAEHLAPEFVVYAPDLPGHGRSDTPPQPLDTPRLADWLVAWMDAVGLQRAALVANSMGCQIAVDVAVRYPQRVDRLVLIGPPADPAGRTVAEHVRRFVVGGGRERHSLKWLLLVDYSRMGVRLVPELLAMLRYPIEKQLPVVKAPTLLVRGSEDVIVPQRWFEETVRLVGHAQAAVIPETGHAVHYSAPATLLQIIGPFLRVPRRHLAGVRG